MLRSAIAVTFLTLYILIVGPIFILHCLITGSADLMFSMAVTGARLALVICGIKVKAEGQELIPPGVCIFVANHTSNLDPPIVVGSIPRRVALLAKKEVFHVPILGTVLRLGGFIPVDRANRDAAMASVDQAVEELRGGLSFLIYPEGTRSADGRLRPFKKGSFVMAIRAQVPIVPVSVTGAQRLMAKGKMAIYSGKATVRFHAPVEVAGFTLDDRDALAAKIQAVVASGLPPEQQPIANQANNSGSR